MTQSKTALIVTTISAPGQAMRMFAEGAKEQAWDFIVVGDNKTPDAYGGFDASYYSMSDQKKLPWAYGQVAPENHYSRKNLGYLIAMQNGAECIIESDDDNLPRPTFFNPRTKSVRGRMVKDKGWVNVYKYYTDVGVWPRGLPLLRLKDDPPALGSGLVDMPALLQQGLADDDPDVDAIYRLVGELPIKFRQEGMIGLQGKTWSPFNSQNTTWWNELFPLLYLPTNCLFRMVDIWRSLVAIVILAANDTPLVFHDATVWQERNEHDLLRDFRDEVDGYLLNEKIVDLLSSLDLKKGWQHLDANLMACYEALVEADIFPSKELPLVQAWLDSLAQVRSESTQRLAG